MPFNHYDSAFAYVCLFSLLPAEILYESINGSIEGKQWRQMLISFVHIHVVIKLWFCDLNFFFYWTYYWCFKLLCCVLSFTEKRKERKKKGLLCCSVCIIVVLCRKPMKRSFALLQSHIIHHFEVLVLILNACWICCALFELVYIQLVSGFDFQLTHWSILTYSN